MSSRTIQRAEEQVRSAILELSKATAIPQRDAERVILLAADMMDAAKRIRERAMRFRHPGQHSNDNNGRSH